ncbi:methylenetetrahydrofolate reductase [Blochmannia endosymbiont of Polyrhachis (Hedomyrma) turneri]|uniref:methylenetetrahydrofolate reductase n=1 Tax=Blochmannia endosymbiont of Polyrhachis (Hedomyrma) turneri TaxID=1505596 RepID=UPI00061A743C|nr:methylenetetrahydrofolate reductase [Blochmannia endosymbiont of Polyrhachis (Hedomyrma) turneri]AKC60149.1 5,10-methylenetetrahydrofolate reductase [Blochmannia endosymbiont of Polyrhachis (Hedomyrma) turneri]
MDVLYVGSELLDDQFMLNVSNGINVSFEFFPPHNEGMKKIFWQSITKLSELAPVFVSVTSGVNFRNSDYVYNIIQEIKCRTGWTVAPHLTCIDVTLQQLTALAEKYWNNGIRHIVALRGDPVDKVCQSAMYAIDLVVLLKRIANFDISVAAYPEVHPEAISAQSDLLYLKKKIDAGANRAITQFFFDVEKYLKFRDLCVSSGISIPIVPGILPVFDFCQLKRFLTFTRVVLPRWVLSVFDGLESDKNTQKMIGIVIAMEIIRILIREEVRDFHFYTLNRFELTYAICSMLGVRKNSKGV